MQEIMQFQQDVVEGANPRDIKFQLGREMVARFHDEAAADAAQASFIARFQKGAVPDEIPEFALEGGDTGLGIASLLKEAGLTGSTSESFRMIKQGAVRIDGARVEDKSLKRRFARVTVT